MRVARTDGDDQSDAEPLPEVLLASEVAEYLRVSYATVIKMTKAGEIPALAIGREFRYLRSEIVKLLRQPARASRTSQPFGEDADAATG